MRSSLPSITLLISLHAGQVYAQFPSFPDSNALWVMDVYDGPQFQFSFRYHMRNADHDTLIDGIWYSTIWAGSFNETDVYCGGIREDQDSRVYLYPVGGDSEYLLYDFDPVEGDTLFVWVGEPGGGIPSPAVQMMHVATVETAENINGTAWKQIGIMSEAALNGAQGVTQYWIQGVGGTGGLFSTIGSLTVSLSVGLVCMQANDTIWPAGEPGNCSPMGVPEHAGSRLSVHPNPNQGEFTIKLPEGASAVEAVRLLNAQGRTVPISLGPVSSPLVVSLGAHVPGGVYMLQVWLTDETIHYGKIILQP